MNPPEFGRSSFTPAEHLHQHRHDPSGNDYYVTFTRKTVRISSYQDDAIRTAVETWADAVASLD